MDTVVAGLALAYFCSGARAQNLQAFRMQKGGQESSKTTFEGVVGATANYDDEGYDSMSLDHNRNRYFIDSINGVKDNVTDFLEIGPGADAKLTKMIMEDQIGDQPRFPTVTAIESNKYSFEEAKKKLKKYNARRRKRATVMYGDANEVLGKKLEGSPFGCVVMEIIGFVASCEGQCSLLRSVTPHLRKDAFAVPARFGTFLCPYTGGRFGHQVPFRIRNLSANKHLEKSKLHPEQRLTVEDWEAVKIEEGVQGDSSRVFESTVDLPEDSTALVGFIELRNGDLWCSSGHWTGKNGATNWDLFVIPLPEGVTQGPLSLTSTVRAFTTEPTYTLAFSAGETGSFSVELKFPDMFDTQRMPRIG